MFIAYDSDRKLHSIWRQSLVDVGHLKAKRFTCIYCGKDMQLRTGEKRAPHFAHITTCVRRPYSESYEHITAKELLSYWLVLHGFKPELEKRIGEHRADVFVEIDNIPYVLEIQKSHITEKEFLERHLFYEQYGYKVKWFGIRIKGTSKTSIRSLTIREALMIDPLAGFTSLAIDVTNQELLIDHHFTSMQPQKMIHLSTAFSLDSSPRQFFDKAVLEKPDALYFLVIKKEWLRLVRSKRKLIHTRLNKLEKILLRTYQSLHKNLNFFPAICHLPILHQADLLIRPELWQSFIVIHVINKKPIGAHVNVSQVSLALESVISADCVLPISVSWHDRLFYLINEYLQAISYFGVVKKVNANTYKITCHVTVNKPIDTLINDDDYVMSAYQKYFETKNN
ncbi:hypothetical protein FLK61_34375 [Paenalkalicoccus suaedae]|uniref:Competence protein CoiA n=1 Tax=Paenalkalicoccus suaedae TaxID=2592382 RepID=A0A859FGG6_9BACI|nr:competence protein CoiA family protein [Paenalkalicoccus suaedae]QKS71762.1 hypothetical protein FLK61_34375 [Paenalkalicoccus suaedae]